MATVVRVVCTAAWALIRAGSRVHDGLRPPVCRAHREGGQGVGGHRVGGHPARLAGVRRVAAGGLRGTGNLKRCCAAGVNALRPLLSLYYHYYHLVTSSVLLPARSLCPRTFSTSPSCPSTRWRSAWCAASSAPTSPTLCSWWRPSARAPPGTTSWSSCSQCTTWTETVSASGGEEGGGTRKARG